MTPPSAPPPPSPSRVSAPRSSTSTPDALEKDASSAEASVFAELDAFNSAPPLSTSQNTFEHPVAPHGQDDDGMQNMILELSHSAHDTRFNSNDQGWAFDNALNVPYFYNSEADASKYSALSMQFLDPALQEPAPVPAPPPPTPQVPLTQHLNTLSQTLQDSEQIHLSLRERSEGLGDAQIGEHHRESDVELSDDKPSRRQQDIRIAPPYIPASWPGKPANASQEIPHSSDDAASPLVSTRPTGSPGTQLRRANSARMRSPGSSTSSAPGKTRVSTAQCPACGKSISVNGANFRRHQQACRRQRASKRTPVSLTNTPSSFQMGQNPSASAVFSGAEAGTSVPPTWMMPPGASSPVAQPHATSTAAAFISPHHDARLAFDPLPNSAHVAATQRRDLDLLGAVQRLERSISTLDVNARLCLRDALVSLSNKASNPHIQPTPEQEAMNRAAEYLVLRMLFLSGQQVMHTAPGTTAPTYAEPTMTDDATEMPVTRRLSLGSASTVGGIHGRSQSGNDTDDGTIAASTGAAMTAPKEEMNVVGQDVEITSTTAMKDEEKLGGA